MKDSIIGIEPTTGRVRIIAENIREERQFCIDMGYDVLTVTASEAIWFWRKNVEVILSEVKS
jgi:hypothetical protein